MSIFQALVTVQRDAQLLHLPSRATVTRSLRVSNGAGGFTQTPDAFLKDLPCRVGDARSRQMALGGQAPQTVEVIPIQIGKVGMAPDEIDIRPDDGITIDTTNYRVIGTNRGTTDNVTLLCECLKVVG